MGLIIDENLHKNLKETYLWRYMSLAKFLDLITTQSIYFAKNTQLITGDPYEGTLPFFTNVLFRLTEDYESQEYKDINSSINKIRNNTYINCWHINEDENYLMWKSYAPQKGDVAIVTDIDSLIEAFETDIGINAIPVNYNSKDFNQEMSCINSQDYKNKNKLKEIIFLSSKYKKEIFKNENELRLIFQTEDENINSQKININLNKLIKGIYLSPESTSAEKQTIINSLNILKDKNIISFQPEEIVYNSFISDAYMQSRNELGLCFENIRKELSNAEKIKTIPTEPNKQNAQTALYTLLLLAILPSIPPHQREKAHKKALEMSNLKE